MKRENKRQWMYKLVERYMRSKLTKRQFCQLEGISLSTLDYWRRKYGLNPSEGGFISLGCGSKEIQGYMIKFPNGVELHTEEEPSMMLIEKLLGDARE